MYLSSCEYYWIVKLKDLLLIIEWKIMLLFYWLYTNNGSLCHLRAVNTFYQNSSSLSTLYVVIDQMLKWKQGEKLQRLTIKVVKSKDEKHVNWILVIMMVL